MVLRFFLLASIFLFTFCHDLGKRDNPDDQDGINYQGGQLSSSSFVEPTVPSSSSVVPVVPSSSSVPVQTGIIKGTPVPYEGETYNTVVIGSQTWMAKNLNYAVEGSRCYNDSIAYCEKYGRLYSWAAAMGIDAKYNFEWWDIDEVKVNEKHKGICPSGWHIPSNAEWTTLTNYVGASTAGTKLRATSDWFNGTDYYGYSALSGTDDYGFSALPGGYGFPSGSFEDVGNRDYWWAATEYDASYANHREIHYLSADVNSGSSDKCSFVSVRCVQD
ncbi:MAG: fibrobacter succinogenes major paralogous domain-containing protein [Fibromonadaceae bacterium]|jgi:uncharacterized protein (TIGR02145 family)|nr:fibrobacter succinogenes major paralogous domain-containing protein [Fibromonadaceae bacterium]